MEEFKRGSVDAEKIYNIPYMFNTPEGSCNIYPYFLSPLKKKSCMYFEINEISCDFGLSGRVKNPQFLKEVASACSKDDHIVVVSCLLSWVIYCFAATLYLMMCWAKLL